MEFIMYKIICNDLNITDCYVGHTSNFRTRRNKHKYDCNNENSKNYNFKLYQFIRSNDGWNNWSMIEIEKFKCNVNYEAYKRERFYCELLNATLNVKIPSRTKLEYSEIHKEQVKKYHLQNKDKIKEQRKQYHKDYYLKTILLKKQQINQLKIENLELEIDELEIEFLELLK